MLDHVEQRSDDTQVTRHRRLKREQRQDPLVHLQVAAVDPVVVGDHDRGELDIAMMQRLQRPVKRGDDEVERAERLLLEPGELLAKLKTLRLWHA